MWLSVQVPVILDYEEKAIAAFRPEWNLSSIEWFYEDTRIEDNSTIRNIAISSNNLQLMISYLTIWTGAENGTEGTYKCRVCKNESLPQFSEECQISNIKLIASSECIVGDWKMNANIMKF